MARDAYVVWGSRRDERHDVTVEVPVHGMTCEAYTCYLASIAGPGAPRRADDSAPASRGGIRIGRGLLALAAAGVVAVRRRTPREHASTSGFEARDARESQ
jgi:hypothetical protein